MGRCSAGWSPRDCAGWGAFLLAECGRFANFGGMWLRSVSVLSLFTSAVLAEVIEFELKAGKSRVVTVESSVDDSHFTEPRGYGVYGSRSRTFLKRVEVANPGDKPITGRLLSVNERDLTNVEGFRRTLGLSHEPSRQALAMKRIFNFWKEHRSHGGAWHPLTNEPFAALNFWGYTLCGEDTQSLARLAHACEIPARYVQLNGHIAAEYRIDGAWRIVDGDQAAVYLKWDNETLAGADDLRADPLLGLRTKVFGKYSPQEWALSAFNTSLIEHVAPVEPKVLKLKTGAAPLNQFTLGGKESLTWYADRPPEKPVAQVNAEDPEVLKAALLATIEHKAIAKNHARKEDRTVAITSPFPIWKAVNHSTGATFSPKAGEVVFKAVLPVKGETDQISVFSQCSRHAVPTLMRGDNMVKFEAEKGTARIAFEYLPAPDVRPPESQVTARMTRFSGAPFFTVNTRPRAERIWWQVSATRDFSFVAPNLEGILPWALDLRFDEVSNTFLSPGKTYYLRVKAGAGGVWGEWSDALSFQVEKPVAPDDVRFEKRADGSVRMTWRTYGTGLEYDVFASNRRDFIPQNFTEREIVAMNHTKVVEDRPNKNLLATTQEASVEFKPEHRFYRVIARKEDVASVPSALFELPAELAKGLPEAMILQARASKEGNRDVYKVTEQKLPAVVPAPAASQN
jgi:hypothetical protein